MNRTSGSATVQLIAVRTEKGQQSHDETEADLDVSIAWANDNAPSDAIITVTTDGKTLTLNNGNNYSGTFEKLTIGQTYTLTATVTAGDGTVLDSDTVTYGPIIDGDNEAVFHATYTAPTNTRDLTVTISWTGDNEPGEDVSITATTEGKTVTLNSENDWTAVISGLEIGKNCSVQLLWRF